MRILRPEPINTSGQTILDARISDKQGSELRDEIVHSVEWSQKFIQMTLPDVLKVTQQQFVSLQDYTQQMFETVDRMFITPLNVMEVTIDRDVDIVPEVEETIQEVENLSQHPEDYPTEDKPNNVVQ